MPPRQYRPWTDDDANTALALVEIHGTEGVRRFAAQTGRSEEGVRMYLQRGAMRPKWEQAIGKHRTGYTPPPRHLALMETGENPDWLERLRPISLPAPQRPRATLTASPGVTMVAGDFHFGDEDLNACSVFLETAAKVKPSKVVLNGDLPDLLAISRYPKDVRKRKNWTLGDEAMAMHAFLRELESVLPRDTEIVETEANHSGDGTASRWWRYLSEFTGALVSLPGAEEKLSYQAWWYPEWSRIRLVESVLVADDLLVLHGDVVRKGAANSARGMMEKWHSSVMNNHTHRQGMGIRRVPPRVGRGEGMMRYYETGCMCKLNPTYASAADWTQGFAIIHEGTGAQQYGVDLITIHEGTAVVPTLGQVVRAA